MTTNLVHYPDLLDPDYTASTLGMGNARLDEVYDGVSGVRHSFRDGRQREVLEVARLDTDVLLVLHYCRGHQRTQLNQLVADGKWLHIQFCLAGSGSESLGSAAEHIRTSAGMCTITGYADSTIVARDLDAGDVQKTACLYLRPHMLEKFFRVPPQALPDYARWISGQSSRGVQYHSFQMHPATNATVNDMLACSFKSYARLGYMRAKSAELIATMLHSLAETPEIGCGAVKLSAADIARISVAKRLIENEVGAPATLSEIAASVGINRSKLAAGFREAYGVTVQAYSRNLRLSRARDLLQAEELTVTDIAERVGYSEVSSFSRAFTAKYSICPKKLRSTLAGGALRLVRAADPICDHAMVGPLADQRSGYEE